MILLESFSSSYVSWAELWILLGELCYCVSCLWFLKMSFCLPLYFYSMGVADGSGRTLCGYVFLTKEWFLALRQPGCGDPRPRNLSIVSTFSRISDWKLLIVRSSLWHGIGPSLADLCISMIFLSVVSWFVVFSFIYVFYICLLFYWL